MATVIRKADGASYPFVNLQLIAMILA